MDYKWALQMEAEELAERRYQREFYDLPTDLQDAVYQEGSDTLNERRYTVVDNQRKEED